jgi:hypothetical protein
MIGIVALAYKHRKKLEAYAKLAKIRLEQAEKRA